VSVVGGLWWLTYSQEWQAVADGVGGEVAEVQQHRQRGLRLIEVSSNGSRSKASSEASGECSNSSGTAMAAATHCCLVLAMQQLKHWQQHRLVTLGGQVSLVLCRSLACGSSDPVLTALCRHCWTGHGAGAPAAAAAAAAEAAPGNITTIIAWGSC